MVMPSGVMVVFPWRLAVPENQGEYSIFSGFKRWVLCTVVPVISASISSSDFPSANPSGNMGMAS